MSEVEYCIVCLTTDVKFYSVKQYSLGEIYSELTRIPVPNWNNHLCFECASLIQKYQKFKLKCIQTHNILKNTVVTRGLTESALEIIQGTFKIGSYLAYSDLTTEDITEIDPDCFIDDEIKIENDSEENITNSIDSKDDGVIILLQNEADKLPTEYSKENLIITGSTNLGDESAQALNYLLFNPRVVLERLEDMIKRQYKVVHEPNRIDDNTYCNDIVDAAEELPTIKLTNRIRNESVDIMQNLKKYGTLQFLTQEQAKQEVLNRANSENYVNSPYKCNLCFRGFTNKVPLDNHMVKHSPAAGLYKCDYCHYRYPTKRKLAQHLTYMHKANFICSKCPFMCDMMIRAHIHVRIHEGKTYDCKYCDRKYNLSNALASHINVHHKDRFDKEHICEFCGSSYNVQHGLRIHKRSVHLNEKNNKEGPECKTCGVHFASDIAWQRHLVLSGNHNAEVKRRKGRKTADTQYTCEFCGLEFNKEYNYKYHLFEHHGQPKPRKTDRTKNVVCEICGAKFWTVSFMKEHLMKHTGERPYACQYCGERYRLLKSFKRHENMHTRAQVYKCGVCDKQFLLHASYSRHMKVHYGLTPHKCEFCEKSFINKSTLNAHIRHAHQKIPYPKPNKKSIRKRKYEAIHLLPQTEDEES